MKGDSQIIAGLNAVLANELVAINQYFLHARMFKNWGLGKLNEADYKVSIQKMKNADKIIERVLFLEGLPNLQDLGRLRIGEETAEIIQCNMDFELDALTALKDAIAQCEAKNDYISRMVLEKILDEQEEQIDWLESQQYLIENAGIENYIQSQMDED